MRLFGLPSSSSASACANDPPNAMLQVPAITVDEPAPAGTAGAAAAAGPSSPPRASRPLAVRYGSCTIQRGFSNNEPVPIRSRHRAATVSAANFRGQRQPLATTALAEEHAQTKSANAREAQASNSNSNAEAPGTTATAAADSQSTTGGSALTWAKSLVSGGSPLGRKRAATTMSGQRGRSRAASTASRLSDSSIALGLPGSNTQDTAATGAASNPRDYDTRVHDLLDVIDPEVQVLNTLGDLQNSLFIPSGFGLFDRTRKVQLTKPPCEETTQPAEGEATGGSAPSRMVSSLGGLLSRKQPDSTPADLEVQKARAEEKELPKPPAPPTRVDADGKVEEPAVPVNTEETVVAEREVVKGKYFVLPSSLVDMSDWSEQEKADLDDYVRHLMHSKKEIFRRKLRGFKKYVSTPLGAFVTIYASLLTFWGAAWVLFLIGWIPAGDRQAYWVEICDQILVALFCTVGLGLIPWRIRDSYHTWYIVKYHRKTLKLRKARGLPKLADDNDLPNDASHNVDIERAGHGEDAVLPDEEQAIFLHHQAALQKAHTYYRPHETLTHHAFPIKILIIIIVLCDLHSTFQLALGSATWSISYHKQYKKILTTIVLCFSLTCNISSGIWIAVGNRRTRKVEVVEALMRQAITAEALKRKEDAEAYRAEKREERERDLQREREKELEKHWKHSLDMNRTGSLPIDAGKSGSSSGLTRRGSDPGSVIAQSKSARVFGKKKLVRSASERRLVAKHGSSVASSNESA